MLIRDLERNTACIKIDQYVIQIQFDRDVETCSNTYSTNGTLPRKLQKYTPSDGFWQALSNYLMDEPMIPKETWPSSPTHVPITLLHSTKSARRREQTTVDHDRDSTHLHRIGDGELEGNEQPIFDQDRDSTHLHRIGDGELEGNDQPIFDQDRDSTHLHRIGDGELEGNEQPIFDQDRDSTYLHRIGDGELEGNEQSIFDQDRDSTELN